MHISKVEAMQYILAEKRLKQINEQYQEKVQEVYDLVHPTQIVPNYDLGVLEIHSINPLEFAVKLCEVEEEYKEEVHHLKHKIEIYNQVKKHLTEDDLNNINNLFTIKKVQRILSDILPVSERKDALKNIMEHDKQIDNMSIDELLHDYVDYIGV